MDLFELMAADFVRWREGWLERRLEEMASGKKLVYGNSYFHREPEGPPEKKLNPAREYFDRTYTASPELIEQIRSRLSRTAR